MPLSEHERQLLQQMENDLRAPAPRGAMPIRAVTTQRRPGPLAVSVAVLGLVAGLAVLFVGAHMVSDFGTALGVVGGLLFLGSCDLGYVAVRSRRHRSRADSAPPQPGGRRPPD